jgi:hypothetical protein
MKKISIWGLVLILICGLALPVAANTPIKLYIDGQLAKIDGLLINNRTYVPVRFVSETLGASVDYVDGVVQIYTKPGLTETAPNSTIPLKRVGEKVTIGDISYTIDSITYSTKGAKRYASITFLEESKYSVGEFGLLPAFHIQQGSEVMALTDYTITAQAKGSLDNTQYRRIFTYTFPWEGEVNYVYYFPQGSKSVEPIGRWQR